VRVRVSGLYCSVITRSTAPDVGSTCTRPPRTSFGEPGKGVAVIGQLNGLGRLMGGSVRIFSPGIFGNCAGGPKSGCRGGETGGGPATLGVGGVCGGLPRGGSSRLGGR